MVFLNTLVASFESVKIFHNNTLLALFFLFFFINDLPAFLSSFISRSVYAHDLAIWFSSPSVSAAVEATQEALINQSAGLRSIVFFLIPANVKPSFSGWISIQLNS